MRPSVQVHDALACLLTYPGEGGAGARYPEAVRTIAAACPETAEDLELFLAGIAPFDEGELEELYTRTFDNVADRSLEVGWQLFGENYARGTLMVRFRGLMREHGVEEGTELPDHMSHVIPLLARLPREMAAAFVENQVEPGLRSMLEGLRSYGSPWVGVLEAVRKVLAMHAQESRVPSEAVR